MDKAQGFHAYFFSIIVGLEPWNYVWKLQKAQEKFLSYGRILTLHYYFLLMCILFPIVSSIMDFITNNYWLMRKSWIKSSVMERNSLLIEFRSYLSSSLLWFYHYFLKQRFIVRIL